MNMMSLRLLLAIIVGWMDDRRAKGLAYLQEENRILRAQIGGRVSLTDAERCRLAIRGRALGRSGLRDLATIATPDTILRWHRRLVARKGTYRKARPSRSASQELRALILRMAEENPTWGSTRIRGALKSLGHQVGRSTIARILKAHGISPVPGRPPLGRRSCGRIGALLPRQISSRLRSGRGAA
jgi:hypothetical protein